MIYVLIFLFIVIVGVFIVSNQLINTMFTPARRSHQEIIDEQVEKGTLDAEWLNSLTIHEDEVSSSVSEKLYVQVVPHPIKTKKTVIFIHGFGVNLALEYKYAKLFYDMGYNLVLYDHGNSGNSGGKYTTMGYYELIDLKHIVNYSRSFFGDDVQIGLHGESMGASTACLYAGEDATLAFIVADCGYSDIQSESAYRIKEDYHLPRFPFIPAANLIYKWRLGKFMNDVSPLKAIATEQASQVPALFIHGADDDFTPPNMMNLLYDAKKGMKEKVVMDGAGHARSLDINKEDYIKVVKSFLNKINTDNANYNQERQEQKEKIDSM